LKAPPAEFVDPEAFDASEEQFEASLQESPRPKFIVEVEKTTALPGPPPSANLREEHIADGGETDTAQVAVETATATSVIGTPQSEADFAFWRQQVAARVDSYRARRKTREPRYPSLKLPFENSDLASRTSAPEAHPTRSALAIETAEPDFFRETSPSPVLPRIVAPGETARVIEFPRYGAESGPPVEELAEPVMGRPRIVEAPELVPPPPVLGGMVIEEEKEEEGPRPGIDVPLQAVSVGRRVAAAGIDSVIVLLACAMFGYIFFQLTHMVPPARTLLVIGGSTLFVSWAVYQYLLLVYCGTTPGLRLARLQMNRFDETPAHRNLRRWRVLAAILSGASLGLGYLWSFLDEDRLCWHDRITKTHLGKRR
jgi:RDD family protein